MGADRYSVCPRCKHKYEAAIANEETRVEALYGNVPVEEFDEARELLATAKDTALDATFREDWEITECESDGTLDFYFRGFCGVCELSFKIEEHYQVWTEA